MDFNKNIHIDFLIRLHKGLNVDAILKEHNNCINFSDINILKRIVKSDRVREYYDNNLYKVHLQPTKEIYNQIFKVDIASAFDYYFKELGFNDLEKIINYNSLKCLRVAHNKNFITKSFLKALTRSNMMIQKCTPEMYQELKKIGYVEKYKTRIYQNDKHNVIYRMNNTKKIYDARHYDLDDFTEEEMLSGIKLNYYWRFAIRQKYILSLRFVEQIKNFKNNFKNLDAIYDWIIVNDLLHEYKQFSKIYEIKCIKSFKYRIFRHEYKTNKDIKIIDCNLQQLKCLKKIGVPKKDLIEIAVKRKYYDYAKYLVQKYLTKDDLINQDYFEIFSRNLDINIFDWYNKIVDANKLNYEFVGLYPLNDNIYKFLDYLFVHNFNVDNFIEKIIKNNGYKSSYHIKELIKVMDKHNYKVVHYCLSNTNYESYRAYFEWCSQYVDLMDILNNFKYRDENMLKAIQDAFYYPTISYLCLGNCTEYIVLVSDTIEIIFADSNYDKEKIMEESLELRESRLQIFKGKKSARSIQN